MSARKPSLNVRQRDFEQFWRVLDLCCDAIEAKLRDAVAIGCKSRVWLGWVERRNHSREGNKTAAAMQLPSAITGLSRMALM